MSGDKYLNLEPKNFLRQLLNMNRSHDNIFLRLPNDNHSPYSWLSSFNPTENFPKQLFERTTHLVTSCLLYTSDAADE